MLLLADLEDVATLATRPGTGNPGGGGSSSGPWFWIGLVFIVVVAAFVFFRWLSRRGST